MKTIYDVPIILRREIEALMVKPFIDAFEKELGHEKTYEIVEKVIAEIAFELNFECVGQFSTFFRKKEGVTPSEFRRQRF